ncbi:hypothetical protein D3C80_1269290 [compost metagenome]
MRASPAIIRKPILRASRRDSVLIRNASAFCSGVADVAFMTVSSWSLLTNVMLSRLTSDCISIGKVGF